MTYEGRKVVDSKQFNPEPSEQINISTKKRRRYLCMDYICLDTETSWNHDIDNPIGWIYQWCFSYKNELICGRKPSELVEALLKVIKVNNIDDEHVINIFIHNLSYDYVYIKEWLKQALKDEFENLAIAKHKLITSTIKGCIFKCTYRLTGKSLDDWSTEMGTEHKKLVDTVDYSQIRYQDTELTETDWKYMWNDVIVLDEALKIQMDIHGDTLKTLPLTCTGYVRREAKRYFGEEKQYRYDFKNTRLTFEQYLFCKQEFSGGITHGNRFLAGKKVSVGDTIRIGNKEVKVTAIKHRDFASHYPSQQRCYKAPKGKFFKYYDYEFNTKSSCKVEKIIKESDKYCFLVSILIEDMELRDRGITLPYAQSCKFYQGKIGTIHTVEDNGRILSMTSKSVVVMNETDLLWFYKQYKCKYKILKVYASKKGEFPKWLIKTVDDFFEGKTLFKQKEKELESLGFDENTIEWIKNHRDLMIKKGMLNGVYGMSATDPIRESFFENEDGEWEQEKKTEEEMESALDKYYENWGSFMSYQLGCWTTANARNELMEFVELIGYDHFLYADTDSIFYISDEETEKKIEAKNKEFRDIDDENHMYIEVNGKRVYYNQFELEKEDIKAFKFLHAKCYGYELVDGELKVTIAGVKKHGRNKNTRVKELGTLDNLESGKKFIDCGGTRTIYPVHTPDTVIIDGHLIEYSCSAIITETDKTLKCGIELAEEDFEWQVAEAV